MARKPRHATYSVAEVADRWNVHPETVRQRAKNHELPAHKAGPGSRARWLIDASAVDGVEVLPPRQRSAPRSSQEATGYRLQIAALQRELAAVRAERDRMRQLIGEIERRDQTIASLLGEARKQRRAFRLPE